MAWRIFELLARVSKRKVWPLQAEIKAGRLKGISGRDLFTYKQDLFVDDEGAADDAAYTRDEEAVCRNGVGSSGAVYSLPPMFGCARIAPWTRFVFNVAKL
jgi:hypothetical protein